MLDIHIQHFSSDKNVSRKIVASRLNGCRSNVFVLVAASELNQMAWLLKVVAIELRGTAATKQVPQLTCLVDLLVREPSGVVENFKEPIRTYKLMENEQYLFRPKGLGTVVS